jgi:hypothetical protein
VVRGTWLGYLFGFSEIRHAQSASRNVRGVMESILQTFRNNNQTATSSKGTGIEYIVNNKNYLNDKERIADMVIFLVCWTRHDSIRYRMDITGARSKPLRGRKPS